MQTKNQAQLVRPYIRVSNQERRSLIHFVFELQWKIIAAAKFIGVNYASAKNIIKQYKSDVLKKKRLPSHNQINRCSYKLRQNNEEIPLIISQVCGKAIRKLN